MELVEAYIQTQIQYEKGRFEHADPSTRENVRIWISTIEGAPRSIEAIQSLIDAKEVAMNKADDIVEFRRLDKEWTALLWLQNRIRKTQKSKGSAEDGTQSSSGSGSNSLLV